MHGLMEGKYIMVKAPCLNNSSSSINLKNWNIENFMSFAFVKKASLKYGMIPIVFRRMLIFSIESL